MKPQKELTDAEYQAKYIDKQPKKPANKKYGFCEYRSNEDRHWNLDMQKSHDKKSKEIIVEVSRKFATPYQLEQLAMYQAKEQTKLNKEK